MVRSLYDQFENRNMWMYLIVTLKELIQGADKSLARPGRKQARKRVRDARDFNNIETRAVINLFFLQGKAPKEIHDILTEILACFFPGRAKDLSVPLYTMRCHILLQEKRNDWQHTREQVTSLTTKYYVPVILTMETSLCVWRSVKWWQIAYVLD